MDQQMAPNQPRKSMRLLVIKVVFAVLCCIAPFRALAEKPDLSHLSPEERQSIEMACLQDKVLQGPAALRRSPRVTLLCSKGMTPWMRS